MRVSLFVAMLALFKRAVQTAGQYRCVAHDFVVIEAYEARGVAHASQEKEWFSLSFQNLNLRAGVKGRALGTRLKYPNPQTIAHC